MLHVVRGKEAIKRELHIAGEKSAMELHIMECAGGDTKATAALASLAYSAREIAMSVRLFVGFITGEEV